MAKFERAKTAERSRRGKLRKARESKIVAGHTPNYGFRFNAARDGYEVNQDTMSVVRHIFNMVGVEGATLYRVVQDLEGQGVPAPRGGRWNKTQIRRVILGDVYKPHTFEEISRLVTQEVAAKLEPEKRYGIWWFNRRRVKATYISEPSETDKHYRRRNETTAKDQDEWIAVPVPDVGVPREVADAATVAIKDNRTPSNAGRRFWELSSGIMRCAVCGNAMVSRTATRKNGRTWHYYLCCQRTNSGPRDCTNRKCLRAEEIEDAVWKSITALLCQPDQLRADLDTMIEQERANLRGDPNQEARTWLKRLEQLDHQRKRAQDLAIEGLLSYDELRSKLADLEDVRRTTERELEALSKRQEKIEELERDRDALLPT